MTRSPDEPCAGGCGKLMWRGPNAAPAGHMRCRDCRRQAWPDCTQCGTKLKPRSTSCTCGWTKPKRTRAPGRRPQPARRIVINGREQIDPRHTHAWRKLRDQVIYEEPLCTLNLFGCTGWSDSGDHIIPVAIRPDLALVRSNIRGCCLSCNRRRPQPRLAFP